MQNAKCQGQGVSHLDSPFGFRIPRPAFCIPYAMVKRPQRKAERETSAGGVVFRRGPEDDGVPRFLLIRDSYKNWGFPKGHLEPGEPPAEAARSEVAEETGLGDLVLHGPIQVIDWYFRFRGKTIHKYCHFFLFESRQGDPVPQAEEGITDCAWHQLAEAVRTISYANARGLLERAAELVQALAPVQGDGAGEGGETKGDGTA